MSTKKYRATKRILSQIGRIAKKKARIFRSKFGYYHAGITPPCLNHKLETQSVRYYLRKIGVDESFAYEYSIRDLYGYSAEEAHKIAEHITLGEKK